MSTEEFDCHHSKIERDRQGRIVRREWSSRAIDEFHRKASPDAIMKQKVFESLKQKYGLLTSEIAKELDSSRPALYGFWTIYKVGIKTPIYKYYVSVGWSNADFKIGQQIAQSIGLPLEFCPFSAEGFIDGAKVEQSDLVLVPTETKR